MQDEPRWQGAPAICPYPIAAGGCFYALTFCHSDAERSGGGGICFFSGHHSPQLFLRVLSGPGLRPEPCPEPSRRAVKSSLRSLRHR